MAKSKTDAVQIEILADGVFVAKDEMRNKGAIETVAAEIADMLVKNGRAKHK